MRHTDQSIQPFLDEDFLLNNRMAKTLYHEFAKHQPIIDYHNHLPPDQIAQNKQFENLTQVWLYGDHYRWRAMRTHGIDERLITGDASDKAKFLEWAKTVPYTLRNPLFHWTHLELQRYFEVKELLNPSTAEQIYNQCNALLKTQDFTTQGLLERMNVQVVCSTDDPIDSLEYHLIHQASNSNIQLYPAFRPDKAILINQPTYLEYIDRLATAANQSITNFSDLLDALKKRIEFFASVGCKVSDHGLTKVFSQDFTGTALEQIFEKPLLWCFDPIVFDVTFI